jgi:hypothetical protein
MNEQGGNYCQNNKTSVRHNLRHKSAVAAGDSAPHPLYSTNSYAPECFTRTFISSVEYCTCTFTLSLRILYTCLLGVLYTVQGMHVPPHCHMHKLVYRHWSAVRLSLYQGNVHIPHQNIKNSYLLTWYIVWWTYTSSLGQYFVTAVLCNTVHILYLLTRMVHICTSITLHEGACTLYRFPVHCTFPH